MLFELLVILAIAAVLGYPRPESLDPYSIAARELNRRMPEIEWGICTGVA